MASEDQKRNAEGKSGLIAAFRNGRRPSRRVTIMLVLAVIFVIGAYVMPFYEGQLLRWVNTS